MAIDYSDLRTVTDEQLDTLARILPESLRDIPDNYTSLGLPRRSTASFLWGRAYERWWSAEAARRRAAPPEDVLLAGLPPKDHELLAAVVQAAVAAWRMATWPSELEHFLAPLHGYPDWIDAAHRLVGISEPPALAIHDWVRVSQRPADDRPDMVWTTPALPGEPPRTKETLIARAREHLGGRGIVRKLEGYAVLVELESGSEGLGSGEMLWFWAYELERIQAPEPTPNEKPAQDGDSVPANYPLAIAAEALIAAWDLGANGLPECQPSYAVQPWLDRLERWTRRPGWQDRLRSDAARLHQIGRPPDEPLPPWEHEEEPLSAGALKALEGELAWFTEPSTEGHRRTLLVARKLWDHGHALADDLSLLQADELPPVRLEVSISEAGDFLTAYYQSMLRQLARRLGVPAKAATNWESALSYLEQVSSFGPTIPRMLKEQRELMTGGVDPYGTGQLNAELRRIATVLERAAGVQELMGLASPGLRRAPAPCQSCGCVLIDARDRCPGCGADHSTVPGPAEGIASLRRLGLNDLADEEQRKLERPGWIPVEERLPDPSPSGAVLGWGVDGCSIITWESPKDGQEGWGKAGVTHWRPLPPAPQKEADHAGA